MNRPRPYAPVFLDLEGRVVVIVGGGSVSARKAEAMVRYGARVIVVAPKVHDEIERWATAGQLTWKQKLYDDADLESATLVIAATDLAAVNERVATDCRARGILVNVVDAPGMCDFIVPAVIERGSIQVAVSTGGNSPAFARIVKRELQEAIGPEYGELNDILGSLRDGAKASPRLPKDADRKRFFDDLLGQDLLTMLRDGRRAEAYRLIAAACAENAVPLSDLVRAGLDG